MIMMIFSKCTCIYNRRSLLHLKDKHYYCMCTVHDVIVITGTKSPQDRSPGHGTVDSSLHHVAQSHQSPCEAPGDDCSVHVASAQLCLRPQPVNANCKT